MVADRRKVEDRIDRIRRFKRASRSSGESPARYSEPNRTSRLGDFDFYLEAIQEYLER